MGYSTKKILLFITLLLQTFKVFCSQEELLSGFRLRLHERLLGGHSKAFLPRLNESEPVKVSFMFELINIKEVNAKEQAITVYGWIRQFWHNPFLQWNASEYGGVEIMYVSAKTIWVPDILMYNNVDLEDRMGGGPSTYKTNVLITSSGQNAWRSPAIFKSVCNIDVTYYPFDMQTCSLKFGSWALHSKQVIMYPIKSTGRSDKYQDNGEWSLIKISSERNVAQYDGLSFDDVTVTIVIGREYFHVILNLIIPCMLISTMIFLGFILPPECGERIGLSITVLLAMTVFQQLTSSIFPSFDFPLLGQYYFATSVEIGISLVATTVVLNFAARKNTKMPKWLRTALLFWTARVVCLRKSVERSCPKPKLSRSMRGNSTSRNRESSFVLRPNHNGSVASTIMAESTERSEGKDARLVEDLKHVFVISKNFDYGGLRCANAVRNPEVNTRSNGVDNLCLEDLESGELWDNSSATYTGVLDENGEELDGNELAWRQWEWIMAAKVLDRALLWLNIISGIVTIFAIFLRAPRLRELLFGA